MLNTIEMLEQIRDELNASSERCAELALEDTRHWYLKGKANAYGRSAEIIQSYIDVEEANLPKPEDFGGEDVNL